MKTNSFRVNILKYFIAFSFIILVILLVGINQFTSRKEGISDIVNNLQELEILIIKDLKSISDYMKFELTSSQYFKTKYSLYFNRHNNYLNEIDQKINLLLANEVSRNLKIGSELDSIKELINSYNLVFNKMIVVINQRGFKDWGKEGEMRKYIHKLENVPGIDQAKVLTLRRHEKDYIIRNDTSYVRKLNRFATTFKRDIISSICFSKKEKDTLINNLVNYTKCFNELVKLDSKLGNRNNSGLYAQLNEYEQNIEAKLSSISFETVTKQSTYLIKLGILFFLFICSLVLAIVIASIALSKVLLKPVKEFSDYINSFVINKFRIKELKVVTNLPKEIEDMYAKFHYMVDQLHKKESARISAEMALVESEVRYREMSDMLPQSLYETDENFKFTYVNNAWIKNFRYTRKNINNGVYIKDILSDESLISVLKCNSKIKSFEFEAKRSNDTLFDAIIYNNPIRVNNITKGHRGIIIDNTERNKYIKALKREKKRAEESDKLKSSFLSNMSHEIRTPMNAIIGFSDLLVKQNHSEEQNTEFVKIIKNNGDALLKLIDDILDIAKIEANELKINKTLCDIHSLMNELYNFYSNNLSAMMKENIKLSKYFESSDEKYIIYTDYHRLKQIFINLINNAIKFTSNGNIEFGYYKTKTNMLEFYVKDSGIGISDDKRQIIFDSFRQAEDSINRRFGGTGLGLTISKNICQLLGGRIWVESEANKGSTFYFTIPNDKIDTAHGENSFRAFNTNSFSWHDKIALIVEDTASNAKFLEHLLKPTGITIYHATNGIKAIEIAKKIKLIDIALIDIQMPEMNGFDTIKQLRLIHEILPAIAQTAYALSGEREHCMALGFDDYISKPINSVDLLNKINRFMEKNDIDNEFIESIDSNHFLM